MSSQREKELRRLIYLRNELIKEAKKELKEYRTELEKIESRGKNNYHNKNKNLRKNKHK